MAALGKKNVLFEEAFAIRILPDDAHSANRSRKTPICLRIIRA